MSTVKEYQTLGAAHVAIGEAKSLFELSLVVSKSVSAQNCATYKQRADFFSACHTRQRLLMDAMGEGAYADKCRKSLNGEQT